MFDDGAGDFTLKRIGGEERALEVEKVVEGQLLSALLLERGDSVLVPLHVERGPLPRIFAVPERRLPLERDGDGVGESFRSHARKPARDRRVVRRRALKNLLGQQPPQVQIVVFRLEGSEYAPVVSRIDDDGY